MKARYSHRSQEEESLRLSSPRAEDLGTAEKAQAQSIGQDRFDMAYATSIRAEAGTMQTAITAIGLLRRLA